MNSRIGGDTRNPGCHCALTLKLRGMVDTQSAPALSALAPKVRRLFELSAAKIRSIEKSWAPAQGAPVFTFGGKYTSRGWTE